MPLTDQQIEKYLAMVEDWDGPREEKVGSIRALYEMLEVFMDIELGTDPVTLALRAKERAAGADGPIPADKRRRKIL